MNGTIGRRGGEMNVRQQVHRLAWLALASVALVVGALLGIAMGEMPEPPMGLAQVKPAAPMAAFTLPSLNGSAFDSSALQGKVVVVRFWATW
jgi:cytochrome oxidase Cu insertion factor (SCO1/SenC/PrrC family)